MRKRENLIEQNSWDKLATLIQSKQKTSTRESGKGWGEEKIVPVKARFIDLFYSLAKTYFNLERNEVANLDDGGILALEKLIARRSLRDELRARLFWDFPIIGQFAQGIYHIASDTGYARAHGYNPKPTKPWSYRFLRAILKHSCGRNWFPFESLSQDRYRYARK